MEHVSNAAKEGTERIEKLVGFRAAFNTSEAGDAEVVRLLVSQPYKRDASLFRGFGRVKQSRYRYLTRTHGTLPSSAASVA